MSSELILYGAAAAAVYYIWTRQKVSPVDPKPIVDNKEATQDKYFSKFNAVKLNGGEHNTSESGKYAASVGGMPENAAAAATFFDISKRFAFKATLASTVEPDRTTATGSVMPSTLKEQVIYIQK